MKLAKIMMTVVLSTSSIAMAGAWTEPILRAPFAKEIEFPEACVDIVTDAVNAVTKPYEGDFPGGFRNLSTHQVTVRGFVYKGKALVFQVQRVVGRNFSTDGLATVRGDLEIKGSTCEVFNVRVLKMSYEHQLD